MNSVQLIGRTTHPPRLDQTAAGTPVTTFRIAVERNQDESDFVSIKTWGRLAETTGKYLARGRRVAIQGRLEHSEWTDEEGRRVSRLIVVADRVAFLDPPAGDASRVGTTEQVGAPVGVVPGDGT